MEQYDVVIVGAGPAGLRCAEVLAKGGKKVIVLEKNKIIGDKVCAGGLTLKDLELGIPNSIIQRKFKKVIIHTPLKKTEIKFDKPFLATIDRKDLGRWMANKAKKEGANIIMNQDVVQIKNKSIITSERQEFSFKYLVGADGSNSFVRRYLKLKNDRFAVCLQKRIKKEFKDFEIFLEQGDKGIFYSYIFPYKKYSKIGYCTDINQKNIKMETKMVLEIKNKFEKWARQIKSSQIDQLQSALVNASYKGHEFGNIFLIGDAGGFASGLTGEGIYFAIKSGEDVAKKILNSRYGCPNIKHILEVKRIQEDFLFSCSEINSVVTGAELEFFNFLFKTKIFNKEMEKYAD